MLYPLPLDCDRLEARTVRGLLSLAPRPRTCMAISSALSQRGSRERIIRQVPRSGYIGGPLTSTCDRSWISLFQPRRPEPASPMFWRMLLNAHVWPSVLRLLVWKSLLSMPLDRLQILGHGVLALCSGFSTAFVDALWRARLLTLCRGLVCSPRVWGNCVSSLPLLWVGL